MRKKAKKVFALLIFICLTVTTIGINPVLVFAETENRVYVYDGYSVFYDVYSE